MTEANGTMRAVMTTKKGGPDVWKVLDNVAVPELRPGYVLVRVAAASLNLGDAYTRKGVSQVMVAGGRFPYIPGLDCAGTVAAVNPGSRWAVGDEVMGELTALDTRGDDGSLAEYVLAKETDFCRKPAALSMTDAASLPLAGTTAMRLIDLGGVKDGDRVLVLGGTGGVGSLALQIAKARGGYVIATASTGKQELIRDLGADEPIDYTKVRVAETVRDVDVVIDCVGKDGYRALRCLKPNGVYAAGAGIPTSDSMPGKGVLVSIIRTVLAIVNLRRARAFKKHPASLRFLNSVPSPEIVAALADMVVQGQVRPVIEEVYPLEGIVDAGSKLDQGHCFGKLVFDIHMQSQPT